MGSGESDTSDFRLIARKISLRLSGACSLCGNVRRPDVSRLKYKRGEPFRAISGQGRRNRAASSAYDIGIATQFSRCERCFPHHEEFSAAVAVASSTDRATRDQKSPEPTSTK